MTPQQQATAARLADDDRQYVSTTDQDKWFRHNEWRDQVVAFLRTLAAKPDDAAAGDAVWQPIETAPKDGTEVLIVYDRYCSDWQGTDDPTTWPKARGIVMATFKTEGRYEFWEAGYVEHTGDFQKYAATHWMSKPQLPEPKP